MNASALCPRFGGAPDRTKDDDVADDYHSHRDPSSEPGEIDTDGIESHQNEDDEDQHGEIVWRQESQSIPVLIHSSCHLDALKMVPVR